MCLIFDKVREIINLSLNKNPNRKPKSKNTEITNFTVELKG